MAQPWALTTTVSQTSENLAPGSRLVTSIGTVTGTRELRRNVGEFVLCIAAASWPEVSVARLEAEALSTPTLAPTSLKSANPVVPFQDVPRTRSFVTNERVGRTPPSAAVDVDVARVGRTLLSDAVEVDVACVGRTLLSAAFDVDLFA